MRRPGPGDWDRSVEAWYAEDVVVGGLFGGLRTRWRRWLFSSASRMVLRLTASYARRFAGPGRRPVDELIAASSLSRREVGALADRIRYVLGDRLSVDEEAGLGLLESVGERGFES